MEPFYESILRWLRRADDTWCVWAKQDLTSGDWQALQWLVEKAGIDAQVNDDSVRIRIATIGETIRQRVSDMNDAERAAGILKGWVDGTDEGFRYGTGQAVHPITQAMLEAQGMIAPTPDQKPPKPKKKRRRRSPGPVTGRQTEAVQLFAEHRGNIAKVAEAMGVSRATAEQHIKAAEPKIGELIKRQPKMGRRQRFPRNM